VGGITRAADVTPTGSPPAAEQASQPVSKQVAAMRTEFGQKQQEAYQAYAASEGKSDEERSKIYEAKSPNPTPYAQKAMALARDNPKDPGAVDALLFVLQMTRGNGPDEERLDSEAIAQISRDDLNDPRISTAFFKFMYNPSDAGTKLMRLAAEKSSNREVQGSATFWLAQSLKTSAEQGGDDKKIAEAKKLYEKVAADYADVNSGRGTLGEQAKTNLFEMENLAIGKPAPDIEGKDASGKPLKLSDYAGKVVVLDFWGNW
jgi:hypothetical protein